MARLAPNRVTSSRTASPTVAPERSASLATLRNKKPAQQAQKGPAPAPVQDPRRSELDATNERFGHDMAWLDEMFQMNPALLGQSAASEAQADPRAVQAQQAALDQLFGIAQGGGATALERSRRAGARADQEGWLRGQREADMQNLAERGMSGSGQELLNLAMDRQAAAQRLSQADLDTDAALEQRALDALLSGSGLAGQMRGASFGEDMDRRDAADRFAQLNQQALNNAQATNKNFIQNAWGQTMGQRNNWDLNMANLGVGVAQGMLGSDIAQDQFGYGYAGGLAGADANAFNTTNTHVGSLAVDPSYSGTAQYGNQMTGAIQSNANAFSHAGQAYENKDAGLNRIIENNAGKAASGYLGGG